MVRKHNYGARVPDTPDGLVEELEHLFGTGAGSPAALVRSYGAAAVRRDPSLDVRLPLRPGNATAGLFSSAAPGMDLQGLPRTLAGFVNAARAGDPRLASETDRVRRVWAAYSSEIPADGGFLVPEELRSELVLASLQYAIVRPRALNIPMGTLRTGVPAVDGGTSNAASIMGGFIAHWEAEDADLSADEDDPTYQRIWLEAWKLVAYGEAPNELMDDSPAFGVYLSAVLPQAMAWYEDKKLIGGNGAGEPEGFLNAPCKIMVTRATSSHVEFADLPKMVARLLPQGLARACWVCSPDALTDLLNSYLAVGSPTTQALPGTSWLWFDGTTWRLLGMPLLPTELVPALGSTGDLSLVDFGAYLLGTRQLLQLDVSEHFKFPFDVSAIRARSRVDGRMWLRDPVTPANSSQTVSAVVVLN